MNKPDPELSNRWRELGVQRGAAGIEHEPRPTRNTGLRIDSAVPGQWVDTPCGRCFVAETRYPLHHVHGAQALGDLAQQRPAELLQLVAGDPSLAQLDFRRAVFFDIETTGLGTGAGMVAFLVGIGVFEDGRFCVRQYFMPDYGHEDAMLHLLVQEMKDRTGLVSFNGRNFDLPFLQTRFTCCGLGEVPLAGTPHLDLLFPARRLWRARLSSCALSSLETHILGLAREADVPGWLIPQLYFDYIRYGEVEPLRQVFVHNLLDIVSLVSLAARINDLLDENGDARIEHATDAYSLGMIYETCGRPERARRAYEAALQGHLLPSVRNDALTRLSVLYKKAGRMERAVRIWEGLAEQGQPWAMVELAKYDEHTARDPRRAAERTRAALACENLPSRGQCSRDALLHRLERLEKRLEEGATPMPHIESYSFGKITIDGQEYTADLLILPKGLRPNWRRKQSHRLTSDDLRDVVAAKPGVLVIGTGNLGLMKVPDETLQHLEAQGIRVIVARTAAACKRYNELAPEGNVAAALHLTC